MLLFARNYCFALDLAETHRPIIIEESIVQIDFPHCVDRIGIIVFSFADSKHLHIFDLLAVVIESTYWFGELIELAEIFRCDHDLVTLPQEIPIATDSVTLPEPWYWLLEEKAKKIYRTSTFS